MDELFNTTESELQEELTDTTEIVEDTEESSENEIVSEETADKSKEKPKKEDKLSAYEKAVLAEMERRAEQGDTRVADALKSKDKNIHECWRYITAQAKKKAVAGCAMIEDAIVFGWAHHYYIEPKSVIDAELKPKSAPNATTKPTTPAKGANKADTKSTKGKKGDYSKIIPMPTKKGGKKTETKTADKVTHKKVNGKVYTITQFALF